MARRRRSPWLGLVLASVVPCLIAYVVYTEPFPHDVADSPWTIRLAAYSVMIKFMATPLIPTRINDWLDERYRANQRAAGFGYRDELFDGVQVRILNAHPAGGKTDKRPAIVFYHGGGWIMGDTDMYHPLTSQLAKELNAVVLSVEYRLAPQNPFPAPLDDCTVATVWFLKHLSKYSVDPTRVALMGDSAGGNLAAVVAQRLTFDPEYRDLPKPKLQVLIYPALQAFDFNTPSYQRNGNYWVLLNKPLMTMVWDSYLRGKDAGPNLQDAMQANMHTSAAAKRSPLAQKCLSHDLIPFKQADYKVPSTDIGDEDIYNEIKDVLLNPDFAPLMREDLRGLPEAYILTAGYDVLRDDGIMYAKRLEKAGVPVTLKDYRRGFHGMFGTGPSCPLVCTPMVEESFWHFIAYAKQRL
ncbi:neutral cholesterol ester hydrolase 1-like [Patiria miniata]|uniref:Alpha/beta hydrolase fold-3 domain-containing protein n=1 Tax=Patiria miniata TaxID=46514 RepID=A0A913ZJL5_PATMI|nr:neutral cholesterol ester hydrolase 1-like [Patiria miniata]